MSEEACKHLLEILHEEKHYLNQVDVNSNG